MTLQGQSDSGRGSSMLSSGEEGGRQPNSQQVSWKGFECQFSREKKGIHNYSQLEWGAPQLCIFSRHLGPLRPGNWLDGTAWSWTSQHLTGRGWSAATGSKDGRLLQPGVALAARCHAPLLVRYWVRNFWGKAKILDEEKQFKLIPLAWIQIHEGAKAHQTPFQERNRPHHWPSTGAAVLHQPRFIRTCHQRDDRTGTQSSKRAGCVGEKICRSFATGASIAFNCYLYFNPLRMCYVISKYYYSK